MNIYVTRHGQTDLNKAHLMQGRTDAPLNAHGREQAAAAAAQLKGIHFDAVYSSPLQRAIDTAVIMTGFSPDDIIKDERIIEVDFGRYEKKKYTRLGARMWSFWLLPTIFPEPATVESIAHMKKRAHSFLDELSSKHYENVLISCHGGIMRVLCGILGHKKNELMWNPKPRNCEIRRFTL
ncbi:MAG: histidine phosphatase family protein [Lachnospiraceae bacterium]|uniref:Histidine phosphatase family protein n=1 Tax=Candidatus Weimeria bifida TaxID=2599074 RepID=A0A6N7J278_9FIRM|nr:histidine phosphatase family protein [Candidatus Weimeria bifida]RRF95900.1 MAG: histidine phosphatase family protein [Lachnospiraceae bacterium]